MVGRLVLIESHREPAALLQLRFPLHPGQVLLMTHTRRHRRMLSKDAKAVEATKMDTTTNLRMCVCMRSTLKLGVDSRVKTHVP